MKAYVSLHTKKPSHQLDHEVAYSGYHRLEVEYGDDFGLEAVHLTFPIIADITDQVITHVAVGAVREGQGEVFMVILALPHIFVKDDPARRTEEFWIAAGVAPADAKSYVENYGYIAPKIAISNTPPEGTQRVILPRNLNPIARVAHQLVSAGLMTTADLHPKLYEAINDALVNAGVPVLPVIRSGAAQMSGDLETLSNSLN